MEAFINGITMDWDDRGAGPAGLLIHAQETTWKKTNKKRD
jgi:hypothetical protein